MLHVGRRLTMFRLILCSALLAVVLGHGSLWDPPGRATAWRMGFNTPKNYNDIELYCGGIARHWQRNKGKCGICGDAYDLPAPRPHEDGGKYGTGVIVKTYKAGQNFTAKVRLTTNHRGFFEFKLCPEGTGKPADQECLDQHPIPLADGSGTKFILGKERGITEINLKLPEGFTCERCVFQWHYKCANNWGLCENGKGARGCGPQEFFRGCADVRIE